MLTSSAMRRWVMSRRMIIGMITAGMVSAGIPGVTSSCVAGMTATGLTRMIADCSRMATTRRPHSARWPGHRSRSIPAL